MIVDEAVYVSYNVTDFIDHHGVRGQRWGVRNAPIRTTKSGNYKLTGKQKVGVTAAAVLLSPPIAVGVYAIMKHLGQQRLSDSKRQAAIKAHHKRVEALVAAKGTTKVSHIAPLPPEKSLQS